MFFSVHIDGYIVRSFVDVCDRAVALDIPNQYHFLNDASHKHVLTYALTLVYSV